jgi:hypothetical protein
MLPELSLCCKMASDRFRQRSERTTKAAEAGLSAGRAKWSLSAAEPAVAFHKERRDAALRFTLVKVGDE